MYALLASGLTVIFGVMRIINIAHGALMIMGAFITYTLWHYLGLDPFVGVVITMIVMFGVGWVLYFVTVRPVRRAPVTSSVLLTFGLAFFLEGVMGFIWGNNAHGRQQARLRRYLLSTWAASTSPRVCSSAVCWP